MGFNAAQDTAPTRRSRLVLADDHQEFLAEVSDLLSIEFDIVGSASDGDALLDVAARMRPDVVVTDLQMPKISGLDAGRRLLTERLCHVVVIVTIHADVKLARLALRAGIQAYVLKLHAGDDLIPAIRTALNGGTFVSPAIASKL